MVLIIKGIYIIKNLENNRVYVGETLDVVRRWTEHLQKLQDGKHNNKELQKDFNIYGKGALEFYVEIFLDEPWTMASKSQAIDRCHRIGAKSNVTVYTLICKNTIDERINEIVEEKGKMSDAIVDGKIVGNKVEVLNYLLS